MMTLTSQKGSEGSVPLEVSELHQHCRMTTRSSTGSTPLPSQRQAREAGLGQSPSTGTHESITGGGSSSGKGGCRR